MGASQGVISPVSIVLCFLRRVPMRLKGLRILVIEDAVEVLDVLIMLLRSEGADAVTSTWS